MPPEYCPCRSPGEKKSSGPKRSQTVPSGTTRPFANGSTERLDRARRSLRIFFAVTRKYAGIPRNKVNSVHFHSGSFPDSGRTPRPTTHPSVAGPEGPPFFDSIVKERFRAANIAAVSSRGILLPTVTDSPNPTPQSPPLSNHRRPIHDMPLFRPDSSGRDSTIAGEYWQPRRRCLRVGWKSVWNGANRSEAIPVREKYGGQTGRSVLQIHGTRRK